MKIRTWSLLGIQSEDDMSFTQKAFVENRQTSIQLSLSFFLQNIHTNTVKRFVSFSFSFHRPHISWYGDGDSKPAVILCCFRLL